MHILEKNVVLQMHVLIYMTGFLLSLQNTELPCHIKVKPVHWAGDSRSGRTTLHLPPQVIVLALALNFSQQLPLQSWFSFLGGIVFSCLTYPAKCGSTTRSDL